MNAPTQLHKPFRQRRKENKKKKNARINSLKNNEHGDKRTQDDQAKIQKLQGSFAIDAPLC